MSGGMSNCVAFHTQIASIMEVLANAAVAEICQVVDDGYAVLRLEVSQYQKENKSLKRRLQMLERQTARRCTEKTGTRASAINSSSGDGTQVFRKLRATTEVDRHFPTAERIFGKRTDVSLKRDEQPIVLEVETQVQSATKRAESPSCRTGTDTVCVDAEETRSESLHIKEERLKENGDPQRDLKMREERTMGPSCVGDEERTPSVDSQSKPAEHTEELTDQHRTRHSVWEVTGLENVLKAEPENDGMKTFQHAASEYRAGSLGSEYSVFERLGHQRTFFAQGRNRETEDPSCSYSTEMDSENLSVQSELESVPTTEDGAGNSLSSLGSLDWKPEIVVVDPAPIKTEGEIRSAWNEGTVVGVGRAQQRHYDEGREGDEVQSENVPSICPPHAEMTVRENLVASKCITSESDESHYRRDTNEKRLFYTYYEKGYSRPKDSEIHHSIDMGERQFTCAQCGKQFAHSANLKRHQRVHTGEKPFSCTQCQKRFSHQHQLKMHQRVHTGERPFNCTHCGKRFTQSSHIKRHLSVHTAEIL